MKYYENPRYTVKPVLEPNAVDKRIGVADLSSDQRVVFEALLNELYSNRFDPSLGGYAGSGKSTCIPLISDQLGDTTETAFCAFTGKAANVLQRKLKAAGIRDAAYVGTIHSLIYRPKVNNAGTIVGWVKKERPLRAYADYLDAESSIPVNRIIIDEASMINEEVLSDLQAYGVPILLVGDHGQLPPVQGKSILEKPTFRLETIHRQAANNPIIKLAHEIRTHGDIPKNFPRDLPEIAFIKRDRLYEVVGESYDRLGLNLAVIVRTNNARANINLAPREVKDPVAGDIVICLKNNPPVFNGMRGIVQAIEPCEDHWFHAKIEFPDDGITLEGILNRHQFGRQYTIESGISLQEDVGSFDPRKPLGLLFDFGIALTAHKSQGSSFREVVLCPEKWRSDSEEDYCRWLYTAVTRAEQKITIVT